MGQKTRDTQVLLDSYTGLKDSSFVSELGLLHFLTRRTASLRGCLAHR